MANTEQVLANRMTAKEEFFREIVHYSYSRRVYWLKLIFIWSQTYETFANPKDGKYVPIVTVK